MAMVKRTVSAKAPSLSTVQVDNQEWVKVTKEQMDSTKIGDSIEVNQNEPKAAVTDKPAPKEAAAPAPAKPAPSTPEKVDWAAKDRSQLVGGRSHDAAELVKVSLTTAVPLPKVLALYKEALQGVLAIANEVK